MSRAYDKWYHSKGEQLQESLEDWYNNIPPCINPIEDLGILDIEEFINEKLMFEYESDMGDIADQKYNEYKEKDI